MSANKKHHFVPKFYLKKFSENEHSICLYNIKTQKKFTNASLRNQCYKNFFYGKDPTIEKTLSNVEGEIANIFRSIDKNIWPRRGSQDHFILLLYILIQHARTPYEVDNINELNDLMLKQLMAPKAREAGISLDQFKITLNDPASYSLSVAVPNYPLLLDLELKLLVNQTNTEFITSDNPIIFYNKLFEFRNTASNTGIASKGLKLFLPTSPKRMILLYDKHCYRIGGKSDKLVKINSVSDIEQINRLQIVAAYENIYFRTPGFDMDTCFKNGVTFRRKEKSTFRVFDTSSSNKKSELITTSKKDIKTNLDLSFVKTLKKAKTWLKKFNSNKTQPVVIVRDQELVDTHNDFMNEVKDGKYNAGDFFTYLKDKPSQQGEEADPILHGNFENEPQK